MTKFRAWATASILAVLAVGCGNGHRFDADQDAVIAAMRAWTAACERGDTTALWEMLSRDARDYYRREFSIGPNSVVARYRMTNEALHPESRISNARRRELETDLQRLPPDPTSMTVQEYHSWRMQQELTPDNIANQARLFDQRNIHDIEIGGERAVVILRYGEQRRYSWVREGDEWKFDVLPATQRALEVERRNE